MPSGSPDGAPRRARPVDPRQLPPAARAGPVGHQPRRRHGDRGALTSRHRRRHPVGQRHRVAGERAGSRSSRWATSVPARTHSSQPPSRAAPSPGPAADTRPAVGGRQPRRRRSRRAPPGRSPPCPAPRRRRTGTGGRPAETAETGGSICCGPSVVTAIAAPPGGRHAEQGARRRRRKEDDAVRIPRPAAAVRAGASVCGAPPPRSSRFSCALGEEANGPAVGRPERITSRPRCPPAAAPSSSPAAAATGGTRRRPRRRRQSAGRRATGRTTSGPSVAGVTMSSARLGWRGRRRLAQMPHGGNGERGHAQRARRRTRPSTPAVRAMPMACVDVVCGAAVSNAPSSARRTSRDVADALLRVLVQAAPKHLRHARGRQPPAARPVRLGLRSRGRACR